MFIGKQTKNSLRFFSVLSFALSALMIHSWATFEGIPPRSKLQTTSGTVEWVQDGRYGIKFRLKGVPQSFEYSSKGNAMGLVYDTLARRDHREITVLFDPGRASGPVYSKDTYHEVYELSVSGKPFRSHSEIDGAWRSDETVGGWLGAIFAVCGFYLLLRASRRGAT